MKSIHLLLAIVAISLSGCSTTTHTTELPDFNVVSSDSMKCISIMDIKLAPDDNTAKIESETRQNSEDMDLIIKVRKKKAAIMDKTMVPFDWIVLSNNDLHLIAYISKDDEIKTIVLNRRNGFLVATSSSTTHRTTNAPASSISYLTCKSL